MAKDSQSPNPPPTFDDEQSKGVPSFTQRASSSRPSKEKHVDATANTPKPSQWPLEMRHRLPVPRISPRTVLAVLAGIAVIGGLLTLLGSWMGLGALTSLHVTTTSRLAHFVALLSTMLFGTVGGVIIVCGAAFLLQSRSLLSRSRAFALLFIMITAWGVTTLCRLVVISWVPFLVKPIAFTAAMTTTLVLIGSQSCRLFGTITGTAVTLAATISLVLTGNVSILGALSSLIVGVGAAVLGAYAWNQTWARMLAARDAVDARMQSFQEGMPTQ